METPACPGRKSSPCPPHPSPPLPRLLILSMVGNGENSLMGSPGQPQAPQTFSLAKEQKWRISLGKEAVLLHAW